MKNIVLPLVCLIVGGVAGYSLRSGGGGDGGEVVPTASSTDGTQPKATVDRPAGVAGAVRISAGALGDLLKELLVDFDARSAQKAAAQLSVEELQSALALLAEMPKGSERELLRAQLYRAWAARDPQAAWKAALADPLEQAKGYALSAIAAVVAKTNPTAAIEMALSLGMGGRRALVMGSVFNEWSKVDVAAAMAYAAAHPELPFDASNFAPGLQKLAEKDPLSAANLALGLKDEYRRGSALGSLMTTWVESDPTAAFDWALALTNPKLRQDAITAAVGAWAKSDPKAALAYVETIPDGDVRISSFKKAWADWFRNDPLRATEHLAAIKDDKLLQGVRFEFSYSSEGLSPQERGELLGRIPDGEFKSDVLRTMTDSHIRKGNYNEAISILNGMPDSAGRDRSMHRLSEEWAKNDPAAVAAWLKKMPDTTDRDLAVAGYSATLARSDPASAIEWAQSIPDAKVRSGALRNIATNWVRVDAAKAEAWINGNAGFSDSDKRMIQSMAKMAGDISGIFSVTVGKRR